MARRPLTQKAKVSMNRQSKANDVIAALQLLGAVPDGAANDPVLRSSWALEMATDGRSGTALPLPRPDRPNLADYFRLEQENAMLIDHAEMLACALGACPNCWGQCPDCEDCGGRGLPGAFNPDPVCYARFVQPVVDRMTARQRGG